MFFENRWGLAFRVALKPRAIPASCGGGVKLSVYWGELCFHSLSIIFSAWSWLKNYCRELEEHTESPLEHPLDQQVVKTLQGF